MLLLCNCWSWELYWTRWRQFVESRDTLYGCATGDFILNWYQIMCPIRHQPFKEVKMWYSPETLTTSTCHTQYKHTELTLHVGWLAGSPDLYYTLTYSWHIGVMLCYTTTAHQLVFLRQGGLGRIMCQMYLNYELEYWSVQDRITTYILWE